MIEKENNITFLHFNGKFLHIYLINIDYFIFLFIFIDKKSKKSPFLFFF